MSSSNVAADGGIEGEDVIRGFGSRPSKQALHISSASRLYRRGAHTKEIERPWADANSTAERNSFHRPAFGKREKGENVNRRAVRTQEITWEESPFKTKLCLPVASAIAIAVFTANVAALISHWFPEADSHRKAEEKGHNTEQHTHENTPLSLGRSARNVKAETRYCSWRLGRRFALRNPCPCPLPRPLSCRASFWWWSLLVAFVLFVVASVSFSRVSLSLSWRSWGEWGEEVF